MTDTTGSHTAGSDLKARITEAMKDAMRAQDKVRLGTIRLIQADIKRVEVDERISLDDARVLTILDKMVKQRRDSIAQFEQGNRPDLVAIEAAEILVIQEFLPTQLSTADITTMLDQAIAVTGAKTMQDMGKLMAVLKPQLQGRADMGEVSKLVKARIG